jgi:4,5-DOPA dioxygenase extradiol
MDDDVLIIGSGNVVHNLRAISWGAGDQGFDWAERFDDDARTLLKSAPDQLGTLVDSDDFRFAVPTTDHFLPLAYIAGIAAATGGSVATLAEGCTLGSLSMTSYAVAPTKA